MWNPMSGRTEGLEPLGVKSDEKSLKLGNNDLIDEIP
jgi:hypothetical protein